MCRHNRPGPSRYYQSSQVKQAMQELSIESVYATLDHKQIIVYFVGLQIKVSGF